jgi:hypothetical protein
LKLLTVLAAFMPTSFVILKWLNRAIRHKAGGPTFVPYFYMQHEVLGQQYNNVVGGRQSSQLADVTSGFVSITVQLFRLSRGVSQYWAICVK